MKELLKFAGRKLFSWFVETGELYPEEVEQNEFVSSVQWQFQELNKRGLLINVLQV